MQVYLPSGKIKLLCFYTFATTLKLLIVIFPRGPLLKFSLAFFFKVDFVVLHIFIC